MSQATLGLDIGKSKLHAALLLPGGKTKPKVIANTPEGHRDLLNWIERQGVAQVHACLEATSTYGEAIAQTLYNSGHRVSIVNPSRVKGFAQSEMSRTKTDKVDAALIARFCAALGPALWIPAPPQVRQLQALIRRLDALNQMHQQEANRLHTATTESAELIQPHLAYLEQDIQRIQQCIRDHFKQHPDLRAQKDLLSSIPGIGETTAAVILGEIQSWSAFSSGKQLAAYIGLSPQERSSGSSVRSKSWLSCTGSARLRWAFAKVTCSQ